MINLYQPASITTIPRSLCKESLRGELPAGATVLRRSRKSFAASIPVTSACLRLSTGYDCYFRPRSSFKRCCEDHHWSSDPALVCAGGIEEGPNDGVPQMTGLTLTIARSGNQFVIQWSPPGDRLEFTPT